MSHIKSYPFSVLLCLLFFVCTKESVGQKPTISSLSTLKGNVGTTVTITGSNFSPTPANNIVYFGDVKATVSGATPTSLTVVVPPGANYKPVSVSVNSLTSYSSLPFDVTFGGDRNAFTNQSFAPAADSSWGFSANFIGSTDLDGDGDADPVLVNANGDFISVLKNNGSIGSISLSYSPALKFTTGDSATAAAFGDLDGDGRQDIVVVNSKGNSLSIFKNNSTVDIIQLLPKVDLSTGSSPAFAVVTDIDDDGKPDIVCTNSGSNSFSVFRNTSTGGILSFAPKNDIATGKRPYGLAAADVDGDRLTDIAVADVDDFSVSVFKNTSSPGALSFANKTDLTNLYASMLAAADFDSDGKIDLLSTTSGSSSFVNVIRNTTSAGNISFGAAQQVRTGFGTPTRAAVGDIDGDGQPDLVVNHEYYSTVSILKNHSQPGTLSFNANVDFYVAAQALSLLLTDLDNDARPDLVSGNITLSALSILRNLVPKPFISSATPLAGGSGTVVTVVGNNFLTTSQVSFGGTPASSFLVQSPTTITAVVDTGSTGEIVVTTAYGRASFAGFSFSKPPTVTSFSPAAGGTGTVVTITGTNFNNATSVRFGSIPATSFTVVSPTVISATVPLLADSSYDVSVTNAFGTGTRASFYTGVTIRSFYPTSGPAATAVTISGTHFSTTASENLVYFGPVRAAVLSASPTLLVVAAPTGTSYQPITVTVHHLTANTIQPFIETFKGKGNEFTDSSFGNRVDTTAGDFPGFELIVDLNGDGKPDVVSSNLNSSVVSVNKNTSTGSSISFQRKVDYAISSIPHGSCYGDLDGDGQPDVVVLQAQKGVSLDRSFTVFKNVSTVDTILLVSTEYNLPNLDAELEYPVIADFDGDGKPDVAILSRGVSILRNTSTAGSISFAPRVDLPMLLAFGTAISLADMDGDGKMDIVATGNNPDYVYVFRNQSTPGNISFAKYVTIEAGFGPNSVGVGDLNNDGKSDMVVVNTGNNAISTYKNISTPGVIAFEPRINYSLGVPVRRLSIGDMDGDGRLDISFVWMDQFVYVMKNTSSGGAILFGNKIAYTAPYGPMHVSMADMNNDGKQDIITGNYTTSNKFSVLLNKCLEDGLPPASIHVMGPTEFCEGGNVVLKTASVNGAGYQWYKDGTALASATDSVFTASLAGIYSVKMTNGGMTSASAPVNISVISIPPAPALSVTGTGTLCQGNATVLHSSQKTGITWFKDNAIIDDIIDSVYWVTKAGRYKVVANSSGCANLSSNEITISVLPVPAPVITATSTSFCNGGTAPTLNANTDGGYSYQWNANNEQLPGAVSSALTVNNAGSFSVTETNNGCGAMSQPIIITAGTSPPKPGITLSGADLRSSAAAGNQWYKDGVAITGATAQTYTPTSNGNYSVQVSQNGCKSSMSDAYVFVVTAVVSVDGSHFIKLSPNPVVNEMNLEFNLSGINQLTIDLIDMNGKLVQRWKHQKTGSRLSVSKYARSIYFARVYSPNGKIIGTMKLIKQ